MTADGTYRSARAGETVTTVAEFDALPAGFVGREPDGSIVTRLLDGQGAVWRRTGDGRNLFPERVALPLTVLFRPDAPQPATTDDAIERAVRMLDDLHVVAGEATDDGGVVTVRVRDLATLRAALAAAGAGAEPRATLLRLADEMQQAEWPGTGAEARAVVEAIADTLRDEAARSGAEAELDREALALLRGEVEAAEQDANGGWNGHTSREEWAKACGRRDAFRRALHIVETAARGDAATPTEVEWGVEEDDGDWTIFAETLNSHARQDAEEWARIADSPLMQRTVSAWREVR